MSSTIDRRIAARRRTVREAGARRRLRWLLGIITLAGSAAFVGWLLFQSSLLAIRDVVVDGQARSAASTIVSEHGVVAGIPTISVSGADLEQAIRQDPWVAHVDVRVSWPGLVEVSVVEHVPAGWVPAGSGWLLVSGTGAVVDRAAELPDGAPTVHLEAPGSVVPGDVLEDPAAVAAFEFLAALPAPLVAGASIEGSATELVAVVAGHHIQLGFPIDMREKAATLAALLDDPIADGAAISLVSPSRPAVLNPQSVVETSDAGSAENSTSG